MAAPFSAGLEQSAQSFQIHAVFGDVVIFWRFQNAGSALQSLVSQQELERIDADHSLADMGVPIAERAEFLHRVVQMQYLQTVESNGLVETLHGGGVGFGRADIVSGSKSPEEVNGDYHTTTVELKNLNENL